MLHCPYQLLCGACEFRLEILDLQTIAGHISEELGPHVLVTEDVDERIQPGVQEIQGDVDVVLRDAVEGAIVVERPRHVADVVQK